MIYFNLCDIWLNILRVAQYIVFFLLTTQNKLLYITSHLVRKFKPDFAGKIEKHSITPENELKI
jgi:hypothetical protein